MDAQGRFTNLAFDSFCSPWTTADGLANRGKRVAEPSPPARR